MVIKQVHPILSDKNIEIYNENNKPTNFMLRAPLNAFHAEDKYNKKNIVIYADMLTQTPQMD